MQPSATSTDLSDSLLALFRHLALDPEAHHLRAIDEHDLTVSQVRALVLLACSAPETLPGARIAERLGMSPPAVSRALDGLARVGFVTRSESEEDRRVRPFAITDAGMEVAEELTALRRAQLERFVESLEPARREALEQAFDGLELRRRGE